ncbi:hypothetical protein ACTXT7_005346 [Hymenolepis weldensis]
MCTYFSLAAFSYEYFTIRTMSNFHIEQLHDEAPPLMSGVILSSAESLKHKPVKDRENGFIAPTSLLMKENLFHAAANLFMGSVASTNSEARPRLRRRSVSQYGQVK